MTHDHYKSRAQQEASRIDRDRDLSDEQYVELCEEIAGLFQDMADAKKHEMEREHKAELS